MNISVRVNSEQIEACEGITLDSLLTNCGFLAQEKAFAVAVNCTFVPRDQYAATVVRTGDEIDVVAPIAGG